MKTPEKVDPRDCPACRAAGRPPVRMEHKAVLRDEDAPPELWQCPACRNVEVIYGA